MSLSLKPHYLKRYKDIAMLFLKYGNPDLVNQFGIRGALDEKEITTDHRTGPEELPNDLERLGPTFVKLGQLLSSRADLLPEAYLKPLARLQDKVKPFPYEEVEQIINNELGVRISKAFLEFDKVPLAAASLGQVHKAVLRDGKHVVVKVQRPGIRKQIAEDMEVIEDLTGFFSRNTKTGRKYQIDKIFEEFQHTLMYELDYQREASNLQIIGRVLADFPRIIVPQPIMDYTTRVVLTMEEISGRKITKISPLARLDFDGIALAEELFRAYLKQVLVDGIFHADPHPGNVFLTEDNNVALLDLGMVGRTTPEMQDKLLKLLLAISEGKGEEAASLVKEMSQKTPYFEEVAFKRKIAGMVAEQQHTTLEQIDTGRVLLEVGKTAGESGLYVPTELTMLGKTLLQLDQIGRTLDPKFNPNEAIKKNVRETLNEKIKKDITPGRLLSSFLEIKEFVGGLPARVNKILDVVGNSDFEVKIKTTDVPLLMEGFQKVANRITTGLILAALIVGAALLMQVQTTFTILGYPGLGMLCFLMAGGLGFWLVLTIIISDFKGKRKQRRLVQAASGSA